MKKLGAGIVIGGLLGIALCIMLLGAGLLATGAVDLGGGTDLTGPTTDAAYRAAAQFVAARLKYPETAVFAQPMHNDIRFWGENQYRIDSNVIARTSSGALLDVGYVAVVQWAGGDSWELISLEFDVPSNLALK